LLEAIVEANGRRFLDFPDFSKITIGTHKGDEKPRLILNLFEALTNQQCDANVLLKWGDVISIPKHVPGSYGRAAKPLGLEFPLSIIKGLTNCLKREIEFRLDDAVKKVSIDVKERLVRQSADGGDWALNPFNPRLSQFKNVLQPSYSSKRVQITRKSTQDSPPTSFDLDLSHPESPDWNFWLRDGDIVEVKRSAP
jgi:hypothetical protein